MIRPPADVLRPAPSPSQPNPSEAARSKFSSLPGHAHDLQSVLDEVLAEGPPEAIPEDQQVN